MWFVSIIALNGKKIQNWGFWTEIADLHIDLDRKWHLQEPFQEPSRILHHESGSIFSWIFLAPTPESVLSYDPWCFRNCWVRTRKTERHRLIRRKLPPAKIDGRLPRTSKCSDVIQESSENALYNFEFPLLKFEVLRAFWASESLWDIVCDIGL